MNHNEIIPSAIQKIFPEAIIVSVLRFSKGLASSVYKVEIQNPDKTLAIKFFPKKLEESVEKSAKISNYVGERNIPSVHTYDIIKHEEENWSVMDCLPGHVASEVWETASIETRHSILFNSGMMLKRIHELKIPSFWIHQKHEIILKKEWVEWTGLRIQKYLAAAEKNLDRELIDFLRTRFTRLQDLYDIYPNFSFVPLHWDYHLSNINVDENGEISGVFDFDNAMKGHDMADIGQTVYWLMTQQKISEKEILENLFNGYGNLSKIDSEFVQLHFLLFLAGVMRSTWSKEDLRWLNDNHVEVLRKCIKGEYSFFAGH